MQFADPADRTAIDFNARAAARMKGRIRRRLGASDILQLAAADLVQLRDRFENQGMPAFREMVITIVDRTLANEIEREHAQKRTPLRERSGAGPRGGSMCSESPIEELAAITETPSRALDRKEQALRVQACYADLPAADREIIRLVDYENLSYREASARAGISVEAARQRHSRAIGRLRDGLGAGSAGSGPEGEDSR